MRCQPRRPQKPKKARSSVKRAKGWCRVGCVLCVFFLVLFGFVCWVGLFHLFESVVVLFVVFYRVFLRIMCVSVCCFFVISCFLRLMVNTCQY